MAKTLEGKVAIVTGAARGIGRAYARALAGEGASIVIADINGEGAKKTAAELAGEGFKTLAATVDVSNEASANAMAAQTIEKFGGIDILVNNAALMPTIPRNPLVEVDLEWWDRAFNVNVKGLLICTRAVVPSMKERGGGRIINQASAAGFLPGGLYRLTKHGVVGLTAGLAVELAKYHIKVNAIAPGLIASEGGFESAGEAGSERRLARYASFPDPNPDRPPEDLCGTLLLLAGPGGDYITGQTINVDGGWVIRL